MRVSFTDLDGHPEARTSDAWPTQQTVLVNTAPTGVGKTVTLDEDDSNPFSEADFGYRDGDGDALASVRITVLPAAGSLTLDGNGVQANGTVTKTQLDAGDLVYTPPPDANGAGYASFTFRVSDGTDESALAYTITLDVDAVNDPATGLPTISGTARVGQTLTADVSAIRDDADGLPQASSFLYQWLRVSGANETPILNADARTYRLASADAGAEVQGARQLHRPRRPPRGPHQRRLADAADGFGEHRADGGVEDGGLAEDGFHPFSEADFGYRDGDGDALASVRIARAAQGRRARPRRHSRDRQPGDRRRAAGPARVRPAARRQRRRLRQLHVQGRRRHRRERLGLHHHPRRRRGERPRDGGAHDLRHGACGACADGGRERDRGRCRRPAADTSSFLYQWLRVSGGNETPIQGASASTYRLEAADAGAKFKVRVSFTDLDGHPEARTSDAWPATTVAANAAPTAAAKTVTLDEDTTHTFSAADFGFQDADPGDALASLRIAARPAAGTLALGGTPVTDNQEIAAAQLGQLVFTPPPDANGAGYASFTFKVGDGTDESALSYTITLDVTAVNDPATGLPTISGTARVGQTLTADVSAIRDDADGLPAPASFLYQWLRVSGANETPILNADARTYRLASADAGAKFKVRVSFTDLDGHPEARTSDAWPTQQTVLVNTAPTGVGKTVTLDEDDSNPFSEADFGYRDGDGDALASVRITVLPAAGSLTLDGNGVQANGTVTKTQLDAGDLVYTPPPDANGAGYASFTFRVSDGTDESALAYTITLDVDAVNDPATGLPTISGTARVGQTLTADVSAIRDDADGLPRPPASSTSGCASRAPTRRRS